MAGTREKPIVSKRNHFDGAAEITERLLMNVPDELKHPNLARWLLHCVEWVICDVARDFAVGAQRGIEQTAELLRDPDFYEHRRESRKRLLKRFRDDQAKQTFEREQRKAFPTAEQIEQDIHYWENHLAYHSKEIEKAKTKLQELHAKVPADDFERGASRTTQ